MNRVITRFVAETPGAQLFDWHDATSADPRLLSGDRVHSTPAGYQTRAQLLADAIRGCFDPATPLDGEDLPRPRDEKPAPRRRSGPRDPAPSWLGLLRELPLRSFAALGQTAFARVEGATREMAAAVSPRPAEPKLGTTPGKSSRRR